MGCAVTAVAGDVANMAHVEQAVRVSGLPIRGVFQLAMVLAVSISLGPTRTLC